LAGCAGILQGGKKVSAIKLYSLRAKSGSENDLESALRELALKIRSIAGCERVEIFRDLDQAADFVFIEHWVSLEAQKAGGRQLGKDAFRQVMLTLGSPPAAQTLQSVMDGDPI
jgi:quinol monooxygenase YgiN